MSAVMAPVKVGKMLKRALMKTVNSFLVLLLLLVQAAVPSFAQGGAGGRAEKPLFLSYEQRLVLTYLLAGAGEPEAKQLEISERFESAFAKFIKIPVQHISVNSFGEFLKVYQGHWPNSYSLESDLQLLESGEMRGRTIIRGNTPALQAQIDGFVRAQTKTMTENTKKNLFNKNLNSLTGMIDRLLVQYKDLSSVGAMTGKRAYVTMGFAVADDLLKSHMEVIQQTGEAIAKSGKMTSQDQAMSLFLETVFKEYFGRMGLASKKQIISQFLGQDLNADSARKFEIMVMNSGPQFQKLLQVVARDAGISEDLLSTFKRLESKANPIPAPIVRGLFEAERDRYQWISYEESALGTGTMAQVHRGRIQTWSGETDVVIRFLKPEIAGRIEEDHRILSEIAPLMDKDPRFKKAGYPKLAPVVNDLHKTILDELDLEATKARQIRGKEVYTQELFFKSPLYKNSIELSVPRIYEGVPVAGEPSRLMVQDMADGTKLDKEAEMYKETIPDFKRVLIEEISKVWINEVLFKSGFFHSDLHQGNFMVQLTDPTIKVSILDFGMGGTISHEMQVSLLQFGAGLELNRADVIIETLWSLSEKTANRMTKSQLEAGVLERVEKIKSGQMVAPSLAQWTTWAMDSGLNFPYEFVSLNRGLAILDKSLQDAGSKMTTAGLAKIMASKSIRIVLGDLRQKGLLSLRDLIKLGWMSATSSTVSAATVSLTGTAAKMKCSQIHSKTRTGDLFIFENLLSY